MASESSDSGPRKIIAVIGATGSVGNHVYLGAIERGFRVRVLVRDKNKLNTTNSEVTAIEGSVLEHHAVAALVEGVDVVLSVLGSRPKEQMVVGPGTQVLVDVIRALEIRPRVIHMSSLGIGDSYPQCRKLSWFFGVPMIRYVLRKFFEDMEDAEHILTGATEINTVRVHPTVLDNKDRTGYRCLSADDAPGKFFISRHQVSEFFLDSIDDESWDGKAVSLFGE